MAEPNAISPSEEFEYDADQFLSYDEISIEYVAGVSYASKNAIASNVCNGNIAFAASSVMVITDPRYTSQAFIENQSSREITAIATSEDGRYMAFGEHGVNPSVSALSAKTCAQISRFHVEGTCSIKALLFHPKSLYLAILPTQDYSILVYDFIHGKKLAATKWCVEPLAMTITRSESVLAVCGHRKIMCFSMDNVESTKHATNAIEDKRSILLGKDANYTYVDITSGKHTYTERLYTVTSCGRLFEIHSGDVVINKSSTISENCFCVEFEIGLLFVGCEQGLVKICNPDDLTVAASVCDIDLFGPEKLQPISWNVKSDVLAVVINAETYVITTILSNMKRHSWTIDFKNDSVLCSAVDETTVGGKPCPLSKVITSYDLQCNLAQLLLQSESDNSRAHGSEMLQRQSSARCRQVKAIRITPDGHNIVCGNKQGEIKIFEAISGTLIRNIQAHTAAVTFIELMYDDDFNLVASGGRDRVIYIFDAKKNHQRIQSINDHPSAIVSISLVHNDYILTLVSSSSDGTILVRRALKADRLNFVSIGELPEFVGSRQRVYDHSNGYIITGQERGRINLFSANPHIQLKPTKKLQIGDKLLRTVTTDPTGSFFVAYSSAGQYVFHLQTGQKVATLCALPGFHHLSFSNDLKYLINANDSGCKFLWRLPKTIADIMQEKLADSAGILTSPQYDCSIDCYLSCLRVYQKLAQDDSEILCDGQMTGKISSNPAFCESNTTLDSGGFRMVEPDHVSETTSDNCGPPSTSGSEDTDTNTVISRHMSCTESWGYDITAAVPFQTMEGCNSEVDGCQIDSQTCPEGCKNDEVEVIIMNKTTQSERDTNAIDGGDAYGGGIEKFGVWEIMESPPRASVDNTHLPSQSSDRTVNAYSRKLLSMHSLSKPRSRSVDAMKVINQREGSLPLAKMEEASIQECEGMCDSDHESNACVDPSVESISNRTERGRLVKPSLITNDVWSFRSVGFKTARGSTSTSTCSALESAKSAGSIDEHESYLRHSPECNTLEEIARFKLYLKTLDSASPTTKTVSEKSSEYDDMSFKSSIDQSDSSSMPTQLDSQFLDKSITYLQDEEKLQRYYNEFWRSVQLSNYQETYILKDGLSCVSLHDDDVATRPPISRSRYAVHCSEASDDSQHSGRMRPYLRHDQFYEGYSKELKDMFVRWVLRRMEKDKGKTVAVKKDKESSVGDQTIPPKAVPVLTSKGNQTILTTQVCGEEEGAESNLYQGYYNNLINEESVSSDPTTLSSKPPGAKREGSFQHCKSKLISPTLLQKIHQLQGHHESETKILVDTESQPNVQNEGKKRSLKTSGLMKWERSERYLKQYKAKQVSPRQGTDDSEKLRRRSPPRESRCRSKDASAQESPSSPSPGTPTCSAPSPQTSFHTPAADKLGGVADLFRNQDDYLRKLKEVRRAFEDSIQALSTERKMRQRDEQNHFF